MPFSRANVRASVIDTQAEYGRLRRQEDSNSFAALHAFGGCYGDLT